MSHLPSHRPCVSIVVLRPSLPLGASPTYEVLIVHKPRRRDAWQIPQGGIEEGETTEEAAKRELKEETGITLRPLEELRKTPHVYIYDYPESFKKREKPKYAGQHLTFVMVTVSRSAIVHVDHRELDGYKWISPRSLERYLRRQKYREVVEKVIAEAE